MNHLLNLGHRKITLITGSEEQKATTERIEGISHALANFNLTLNDIILYQVILQGKVVMILQCKFLRAIWIVLHFVA